MIVVDTNVLSEVMKPAHDQSRAVFDWLDGLPPQTVYTTSITVAEIGAGLQRLAAGKRRDTMVAAARRMFDDLFDRRILPFDRIAAEIYARLPAARRQAGLHHDHTLDLQIAAIAVGYMAPVATRDVGDFAGLGLTLINPWDHPAP
ncbi:type II toxin-antitoxin system VapC family toxin [Hansschlegelia zhihuaiae]|uniref:Ribonuclease VapC n=1 Tax=Hansschlegelia zhihuaiae TaxID=405005 RepID=A0A4Q0MB30_9HYPH|nr:type II toxin-antitoxin system VapC family toxin [Hansschlegelia zhihuaiae]RXF70315.1 type II toxin-antitoxin system VapC family toxin [Hansschlegelia zhihuaiae]